MTKSRVILVVLLASLAIVLHCSGLNKPFGDDSRGVISTGDDFYFVELGGMKASDLTQIFNPLKVSGAEGTGWFYRPVFILYVRTMIGAMGPNPLLLHVAGLLLHLIVVFLFVSLLIRLTRKETLAWTAGFLFVLLTGQNEAVWWFSANSALLAAGFYLLAVHGLMSFREKRASGYLLMLVSFALALMSKEDALSLPLVLLLLDLTLYREVKLKDRVISYLPFLVIGAGYLLLDYIAYVNAYEEQFAFVPTHRLGIYLLFWHRAFILFVGNSRMAETVLLATVAVAISKQDRMVRTAGGWFFLACLPVPLASGMHALSGSRFCYLPTLAVSMLSVYWIDSLMKKRTVAGIEFVVAVVAASIIYSVREFAFLDVTSDPVLGWMILLGVVIMATLLAREKLIPAAALAVIVAVAVMTQAEIYVPIVLEHNWFSVWHFVVALVAIATHLPRDPRNEATLGKMLYPILTVFLLWQRPELSLLLFMFLTVVVRQLMARNREGE